MKNVCFYHAGCPDGFGAVWSVWRTWGDTADYRAHTHDEPLPIEVLEDATVVFVDIAPNNEQLDALAQVADRVIVLDHHVTARDRYFSDLSIVNRVEDAGHEIIFDLEHSGAILGWQYFHPGEPAPELLRYVEDQDLWNWKLDDSAEVNAAIASYPRTFEVWSDLAGRPPKELALEGRHIVRANQIEVERTLSTTTRLRVCGHEVEGVNASVNRSALGHEIAKRARHGRPWGCVYRVIGDRVHATLYSIGELDVSAMACELGGGGHRNAAGFTVSLQRWVRDFA